jgi:hypothetical protein
VQRLVLLCSVLALAACGGSAKTAGTTTTTAPPGDALYAGGDWAVSVSNGTATAYHLVGGSWRADRSGRVKIAILGPKRGARAAAIPQVAVELLAGKPLVESGIWVDGRELQVKGGGLTPTRGTIYGAPEAPLAKGVHTAVAYGRTDATGTAVAWSFTV